ncbi:tyrosinase [Penicillium riverlandense]|uniref:tyrosinase n=1 Tax=Penicillium riverlandense TaxID=1903569 RepID=UPI002549620F|nr:tyrosinase [Penicillium riverlandense]KAJ5833967.1 tyrosinase [Penicillium riverlandense]
MTKIDYFVKGAVGGRSAEGEIYARQEIHDLYKDKGQWQLYLLGLRKWYDIPADHPLSYFQIAGIHGMPYKQWNEEETQKIGLNETIGYCTHTTVLFPSWHRPYLVMYEQRLQEVLMQEVLPKIPSAEQVKWKKEIEKFRVPYWDWAMPSPELPKNKTAADKIKRDWLPPDSWEAVVPIFIPGHEGPIANPLYKFSMPEGKTMGDYGVSFLQADENEKVLYGNCTGLSRCPKAKYYTSTEAHTAEYKKWREGEIDNEQIYANFKALPWVNISETDDASKEIHEKFAKFNGGSRAAENVYRMFTYSTNYENFASAGGLGEATAGSNKLPQGHWYQSLEAIHNSIHWWVGGDNNGHMSQVPVASFDPFFWLHHANIERFFSMWQFLHNDKADSISWFEKRSEKVANTSGQPVNKEGNVWTEDQGEENALVRERGPDTPLTPFRKTKESSLTSNDVRDIAKFNYTYPQLQRRGRSDAQIKEDIWTEINQKYSPYRKQVLKQGASQKGDLEVVVNIEYNKYLFGGKPYVIKLYLRRGQNKDPRSEQIGDIYNFSAPGENENGEVCSNCVQQEASGLRCRAQFTLSDLKAYFKAVDSTLDTDDEDSVEIFLKERLYVMVYATSGRAIAFQLGDNSQPAPIQVAIASTRVKYSQDETKSSNFEGFKTFPQLAGDMANLLLVPPGALVLSLTGSVLGTLDESGQVVTAAGKQALQDLTGITNSGFDDMLKIGSGTITGVTGAIGSTTAFLASSLGGSGRDNKTHGNSDSSDNSGGLGGLDSTFGF